jgi:hypothetical protein
MMERGGWVRGEDIVCMYIPDLVIAWMEKYEHPRHIRNNDLDIGYTNLTNALFTVERKKFPHPPYLKYPHS